MKIVIGFGPRSGQGPIVPAQGLEQLDAQEKAEAALLRVGDLQIRFDEGLYAYVWHNYEHCSFCPGGIERNMLEHV